jgi:hypothetical protein
MVVAAVMEVVVAVVMVAINTEVVEEAEAMVADMEAVTAMDTVEVEDSGVVQKTKWVDWDSI